MLGKKCIKLIITNANCKNKYTGNMNPISSYINFGLTLIKQLTLSKVRSVHKCLVHTFTHVWYKYFFIV